MDVTTDGGIVAGFEIKYKGAVPSSSNLTQKVFNELIRDSWKDVGDYWHENFLDKHFTPAGAKEYGYAPRSGETGNPHPKGFWASYSGRKQKYLHHKNPLVFSGELQQMAETYRVVATATSKKTDARIVLPRANKANWRHPDSEIMMHEELTRVSRPEAAEMVGVHDAGMERRLGAIQSVATKQI